MKTIGDILREYEKNGMSPELQDYFIRYGMTKQQTESTTAKKLIDILMDQDGKALIAEAKNVLSSMNVTLLTAQAEYRSLKKEIDEASKAVKAITEAKEQYGDITDEKVKNTLVLYSALLSMNESAGARGVDAISGASYIAYAYLGGQAKREITFSGDSDCFDSWDQKKAGKTWGKTR